MAETGIVLRHSRRCATGEGHPCSCRPTYQAQAWAAREGKPVRKTFRTLAEARVWRQETQVALRRGTMNAPSALLVREVAAQWLEDAEAGVARTRSGERYKPSAIRSYRQALNHTVLPQFGHMRLSALTRHRVQDMVDHLVRQGRAPSTVRNAVLPLRAIYRRAVAREIVSVNPTLGLGLPSQRAKRDRAVRPIEAQTLLAALPDLDRALWTTALYAGLRLGELQALRWSEVAFDRGVLRVEHSWDKVAGLVAPKSRSGRRQVPLPSRLRVELLAHRIRQATNATGFVFSTTGQRPFGYSATTRRARNAAHQAGVRPIGFHECRHAYAAFMIAAGVNAKALSTFMGHSSITVTLERYASLMPGAETEAAALLDTYLGTQCDSAHERGATPPTGEAPLPGGAEAVS